MLPTVSHFGPIGGFNLVGELPLYIIEGEQDRGRPGDGE